MKKSFSRICSPGIIILALLFRLVAFPSAVQAQLQSQTHAQAGWPKPAELPGTDVDVGKMVLIAAGITAVAVVTILLIKSSHKGEVKEDTLKADSTSMHSLLLNNKYIDDLRVETIEQQFAVVENRVPVTLLYDTRRKAFCVGVSLKF